ADAPLLAALAQVGAPRPAHDHDVDGVAARMHAQLAIAVERDRAQVALGEPVRGDRVEAGLADLLDRVRKLHVEEVRRVLESLQVVAEAEHRGPALGLVAADSLEDAGAVVEAVRADVDAGL